MITVYQSMNTALRDMIAFITRMRSDGYKLIDMEYDHPESVGLVFAKKTA